MFFLHVAISNILRRPFRSVLTVLGVSLGVGAFVALVGFAESFEQQWVRYYQNSGTDICVFRGTIFRSSAEESLVEQLRGLPVVSDAVPVTIDLVDFTQEISAVLQGWTDTSYEFDSLTILQGRKFRGDESEVMLGEILAESIGKKTGDSMEIQGAPFQVVGIFRGSQSLESSSALIPLHRHQQISDLGSKVMVFHVRLRTSPVEESSEETLRRARQVIESKLPGLKALPAGELARNNHVMKFISSAAWGTSLVALFIGAIGIANTIAMSIFERIPEIGILRAVGWRRSKILRLILLEALVFGFGGSLLGLAGGYLGLSVLSSIRTTSSLARAYISPLQASEAILLSLGISLAAGFYPACRGAMFSPMEALHHE
jgi:putative ABC transport system permease protein